MSNALRIIDIVQAERELADCGERWLLSVNLQTFKVSRLEVDFSALPGVRYSLPEGAKPQFRFRDRVEGHYQLPGFVLAAAELTKSAARIDLYHPETDGKTGHADLIYQTIRHDCDETHYLTSSAHQPIRSPDDLLARWPDGLDHLLAVTNVIIAFLESEGIAGLGSPQLVPVENLFP